MGKLIDTDELLKYGACPNSCKGTSTCMKDDCEHLHCPIRVFDIESINDTPPVEAIPKANVYNALLELMKYEHEGFINISLARLDEILKKSGVSEDETLDKGEE